MRFNPYETDEIQNLRVRELQRQAEEIRLVHLNKNPGGLPNSGWTVTSIVDWLKCNLLTRKGHSNRVKQGTECLSPCEPCPAHANNSTGC